MPEHRPLEGPKRRLHAPSGEWARRLVFRAAAGLVLIVGVDLMSNTFSSEAFGRSPQRDVVRVVCPEFKSGSKTFCQTLIQSLSESAPKKIIRPVEKRSIWPTQPNDVGVEVIILKNNSHILSGKLGLYVLGQSQANYGAEVEQKRLQGEPLAKAYQKFISKLLKSSSSVQKAIAQ